MGPAASAILPAEAAADRERASLPSPCSGTTASFRLGQARTIKPIPTHLTARSHDRGAAVLGPLRSFAAFESIERLAPSNGNRRDSKVTAVDLHLPSRQWIRLHHPPQQIHLASSPTSAYHPTYLHHEPADHLLPVILDELIAAFATLICALIEGLLSALFGLFNLLACAIELIIGLFITGFKLGRISKPESANSDVEAEAEASRQKQTWVSPRTSIIIMFVMLGALACAIAAPAILNRKITLRAEDGHTLPFASLIIHTGSGEHHKYTNVAGKVEIPRFTLTALTVNDPRYTGKTWQKSEIGSELTVGRTFFGTSLDHLSDRILIPSKDRLKEKLKGKPEPKD